MEIGREIRFALRSLRRQPGFALVAILTLSLGIGANTAIFTVVDGVLLRSLPYPDSERIVALWETGPKGGKAHVSKLNFLDWKSQSRSFSSMAAYSGVWGGPETVTGGTRAERAWTVRISEDFFDVLRVRPAVGRGLAAADHLPGAVPSAVVSHAFWTRSLASRKDLDGLLLHLSGRSYRVAGVMPRGFRFPGETDVWVPSVLARDDSGRSAHNYRVIARLAPSASLESARTEMRLISSRLERQYPDSNREVFASVERLRDDLAGSARPALLVLLAAVAALLLIACANVASLSLARAVGRRREFAIRSAIGAGRWRLARPLLAEALLLSVAGGIAGIAIAALVVRGILAGGGSLPRSGEISLDYRAIAFTAALCLATALISGLAPALRLAATRPQAALSEGGRSGDGGARQRLRGALVAGEVALTMILLVGAGLLLASFRNLLLVPPGFDSDGVLAAETSLPLDARGVPDRRAGRALLAEVGSVPGVESVGAISSLPISGANISGTFVLDDAAGTQGKAGYRIVAPGYIETLRIPVVEGRALTDHDDERAPQVGTVNQALAARFFPGRSPVGRRIRMTGMDSFTDTWLTIVGVTGDVRSLGLTSPPQPEISVSYLQRPDRAFNLSIVIRAPGDPARVAAAIRDRAQAVNPDVAFDFVALNDVVSHSVAARRDTLVLVGAFAALALLLAVVGLYGLVSYTVSQRTREIGVRVALGARSVDVIGLVLRQGTRLAGAGALAGAAGALGASRLMRALLFGVGPSDPAVYAAVGLLLVGATAAASWIPARRAARVDPVVALRAE
jgi:putative ABC transport system permease protein